MNACKHCGVETANASYCSRSCAAKQNNARFPKRAAAQPLATCRHCGKTTKSSRATYCSESCRHKYVAGQRMIAWLNGDVTAAVSSNGTLSPVARRWLIERAGSKCAKCGWNEVNSRTGVCPLQVDHLDGDPFNNTFANLIVLCPNCHALTPTYGSGNRDTVRQRLGLEPIARKRAKR